LFGHHLSFAQNKSLSQAKIRNRSRRSGGLENNNTDAYTAVFAFSLQSQLRSAPLMHEEGAAQLT
jgi:hypothetical protein